MSLLKSAPRLLVVFGAAFFLVGLVWGAFFAGVPDQDPTPSQQASFALHANGSFGLICLVLLAASLGLAAIVLRRLLQVRAALHNH